MIKGFHIKIISFLTPKLVLEKALGNIELLLLDAQRVIEELEVQQEMLMHSFNSLQKEIDGTSGTIEWET